MKNKISSLLLVACCLAATTTRAQINSHINADPEDLKMLQGRTLIVEMKEEDPQLVQKLSKKEKDADRLQHYRDFISNNNDMLKKAVDKYWKFNTNIEYKATSELKDIAKSKDYVIISFQANGDAEGSSSPAIYYDRSERAVNKTPDYYIFLPISGIPEKESDPYMWSYLQSDYDFAIIEMQANINYMIKVNKKMNFEDYGREMAKQNCGKYKTNTLVIDRNQLHEDVSQGTIKSVYKDPFVLTDTKTYDNAFDGQEQGKEVLFTFLYGTLEARGMITVITPVFAKVVIDCSTGNILYYYKIPMMGLNLGTFDTRKQIFDYIEKCN